MRRAALPGDGVDPLDILRAEIQQGLGDQADTLVLAHPGTQRPVQLLVGGIDHRTGVRQQQDLVGGLDPPRLEEHLLAVDDTPTPPRRRATRASRRGRRRQARRPAVLGEDVVDLGGDVVGEPGTRRIAPRNVDNPAAAVSTSRCDSPGDPAWRGRNRATGCTTGDDAPPNRNPTPPDHRRRSAWKRINLSIAHVPMRRRGIADVGKIETQQRTQRRLLQRLVQRASRSVRNRSMSMQTSQSTLFGPNANGHNVVLRPARLRSTRATGARAGTSPPPHRAPP